MPFFLLVCNLMIMHKLGPIEIWGLSFMLKGFGNLYFFLRSCLRLDSLSSNVVVTSLQKSTSIASSEIIKPNPPMAFLAQQYDHLTMALITTLPSNKK
jgi:hypothetical protein